MTLENKLNLELEQGLRTLYEVTEYTLFNPSFIGVAQIVYKGVYINSRLNETDFKAEWDKYFAERSGRRKE